MGRPTKRDDKTEARIVECLRAGNTRATAASVAGISRDTLIEWAKSFPEFSDSLTHAEEYAVEQHVKTIALAAFPRPVLKEVVKTYTNGDGEKVTEKTITETHEFDWRASAWYLERKRPADWRERKSVDISQLTNEQIISLLEEEAGRGSAEAGS